MKTNKYQVALDNAISDIEFCYNDYGEDIPKERLDEIKLLQELVDKETPKKVEHKYEVDTYMVVCPNCNREFGFEYEELYDYCPSCGQKLDWEVENGAGNKNE